VRNYIRQKAGEIETFKALKVGALKWLKEHVPRDGNDWTEEGQMLLDDPELWLSGKDFIEQLAEEILGFVVELTCLRTGKVTKHSFKKVPVDHYVFRFEDAQGREMLLLHYVDDLVLTSTDTQLRDAFLKHINKRWNTTHEGRLTRFLDINYNWSGTGSCT
jgi:hypothetical protein